MLLVLSLFTALLLSLTVVNTWLFVHGFFPQPQASKLTSAAAGGNATTAAATAGIVARAAALLNGASGGPPAPTYPRSQFSKLVLVVVDALRADFVLGPQSQFCFLRNLIQSDQATAYRAYAHAPTVTLPRIKAMITGTVPSFLDLLHNLDSTELREDSLIRRLKQDGRRLLFYGDDTWLKLFPPSSSTWTRSEGTTSFFVQDTVEVDVNVTRRMFQELSRTPDSWDWDVLILHYLGLDHVGHSQGPQSPLMAPKQREMDRVLQFIYQQLHKSAAAGGGDDHLLVLASDHGMSDAGGHGGASFPESNALFVLAPVRPDSDSQPAEANARPPPSYNWFHQSAAADGGQCNLDASATLTSFEAAQVDLAPTLSLLLGIPSPGASVGVLLPGTALDRTGPAQLNALLLNAAQIWDVVTANSQLWDRTVSEPASTAGHRLHGLLKNVTKLHRRLLAATPPRSDSAPDASVGAVAAAYRLFLHSAQSQLAAQLTSYDVPALAWSTGSQAVCCLLFGLLGLWTMQPRFSGLSPFVWIPIVGLSPVMALAAWRTVCEQMDSGGLLSSSSIVFQTDSWLMILSIALSASIVAFSTARVLSGRAQRWSVLPASSSVSRFPLTRSTMVAGSLVHAVSLGGTSLIEEEHQTWYFLVSSLLLTAAAVQCRRGQYRRSVQLLVAALAHRLLRAWNQTGIKWMDAAAAAGGGLMKDDVATSLKLLPAEWNIGLFTCCVLFACTLYYYRGAVVAGTGRVLRTICDLLVGLAACSSVAFHATSWPVAARVAFLTLALAWFLSLASSRVHNTVAGRTHLPSVLLLLFCLTVHRTVNAALFVLLFVELSLVSQALADEQPTACLLLLHWIGRASFFQLGNSNSVSTIDIGCAYAGLTTYRPVFVGTLTALVTYSGPLLAFSFQLRHVATATVPTAALALDARRRLLAILVGSRLLAQSFFQLFAIVHRHHLFVWSVIAPKYVYEVLDTGFFVVTAAVIVVVLPITSTSLFYYGDKKKAS